MTFFEHPGTRINTEIARQVSALAREAEIAEDLHPGQLELMYQGKWLKMFVPRNYGGLGLTLPEVVRLEESLAWADGSTAWVATLCGGAGWFVGFVEPAIAKEFFGGDKICIAGSGSATGTAGITSAGYLINGAWPFASGALHATAFTANCVVHEGGRPLLSADGTPRVRAFIMKPGEVTVQPTWNATGMVATASHSFSVVNVNVPASRSFEIDAAAVTHDDPVYRFPFLQLAETTLAANVSGMTVRYLELASELLNAGTDAPVKMKTNVDNDPAYEDVGNEPQTLISQPRALIAIHHNFLNDLRKEFFYRVDTSWAQLLTHGEIEGSMLQQTSRVSHALVSECKLATESINALLSSRESLQGSDIDRVWRNIQTALTHALFRRK